MELSRAGFITRAASTNLAYLEPRLEIRNTRDQALFNLLIDAQTSGGLLIALAESSLDAFDEFFKEASSDDTWISVGHITEQSNALVRLV